MTMQQGTAMQESSPPVETLRPLAENPDELMKPLAKGSFPLLLGVALVGHVVFFGLTSINFIQLCFEYKSLHPMVEVRAKMKKAAELRLQEERNKALEKFMPRQASAAPAQQGQIEAAKDGPPTAAPNSDSKPQPAERKKSKVERATEEKIMERPKEATNPLEDIKGIE